MKYLLPRLLGAALLAVGLSLLILAPKEFSPGHLFGGLACMVVGTLLTRGLIGTDLVAARLREEASHSDSPIGPGRRDVPPRVFRYGVSPRKRALATLVCAGLAAGLLAMGAFVLFTFPGNLGNRLLVAAPAFCTGLFLWWYIARHRNLDIKVDSHGLDARLFFRSTVIAWDEIVALIARRHYWRGIYFGTVYSVYTRQDKLSFNDRLEGCDELVRLVSEVTGLEWQ
ncbi:MAG: hypothetical protein HUU20_21845 [Pirellulales bacterium]|nr:hypothetical protein [Pirellulales bacterium]